MRNSDDEFAFDETENSDSAWAEASVAMTPEFFDDEDWDEPVLGESAR